MRLPSDRCMLMWRCVCLQPTMHWVSVTVMDVDPGAELKSSSLTPGVLSCWEGYCVEQSGAYTHALKPTHTQKHSHLLRKASEMWGPAIHTLCGVPAAVNTTTSHTQTHTHLTLNRSIIITSQRNSLPLSLSGPLYRPHFYIPRIHMDAHGVSRRFFFWGGITHTNRCLTAIQTWIFQNNCVIFEQGCHSV